ncbi:MAG: hypothetical protein CMN30_14275 [Sandaracinus sp.]|nr:hypothetical protein [Sandaracinus sp.]
MGGTSSASEATGPGSGAGSDEEAHEHRSFIRRFWRPLLLVVMIAAAAGLGTYFEVGQYLTQEKIEAFVGRAGWWGPLAFVGIFTLGQLISVPGVVFVAAAVMAWGKWPGIGASYAATLVSSGAGFLMGRLVGGHALHEIRFAWVRKLLKKVERRPVLSVTLVVTILWMAPPVNYTLGMTKVKLWQFVVGTALGLIPGLLAMGFFFDWITERFL